MKIKNILLAGLLLPAIAFPSNGSFLSKVGGFLTGTASVVKSTITFPYNHPKIATCLAASWLAYCKWSTWDLSNSLKLIERQLDSASLNSRKKAGTVKSLWNWRLQKNDKCTSNHFWQTKKEIEDNKNDVVAKLQKDFNGKTKRGFQTTIDADKRKLKSFKRRLGNSLRNCSFVPKAFHLHDESRFEKLVDSLDVQLQQNIINEDQVEEEIAKYCGWFSWNGSAWNLPVKFLHRVSFHWEAKAARLYWKVLQLQKRLDAIESVIKQSNI